MLFLDQSFRDILMKVAFVDALQLKIMVAIEGW